MTEIERYLLPDEMEPVSHYCHAVRAGDRVWISGTVGVRPDGTIPEDTGDQFQIAIDILDRCLRAAGGRSEHIVKVTVLLTDINDRAKINPIRQRYFGNNRPASTLYEVSALVAPEMKVEIEAEAVVPA
ncbi:MAG: enamine deaminase RidA [Rhodospirillaceae bacterium]|jgi:2-iminobutanoate/2-iminopropanoate deaminase|nr:enamine deaminase RidA [Rhodospirillaceae bacterium]|tara:strand:+ start:582 stop:968 length:387 start_codon:yes stop_codon:yes gene_type:complete